MKNKMLVLKLNASIIEAEIAGDDMLLAGLKILKNEILEVQALTGGVWIKASTPARDWAEFITASANMAEDDVYRHWPRVRAVAMNYFDRK